MALHINLYHEIQRQQLARKRDPLKLGMIAAAVIACGFVAFYFYRMQSVSAVRSRLAAVQADWTKLEPRAKEAKTAEDNLTAQIKTSETLAQRVDSRFYWAPVFEQLLKAVPREVQITKINGDLTLDSGKPIVINVVGVSTGTTTPRKVAEDLRIALDAKLVEKFKHVTSSFRSLEDSDETVMLSGQPHPTANFSIEFQISTADAAPAPAPIVRKPKS